MPILFYVLSAIGFLSAAIAAISLQFVLAATVIVSAVFCLGFGYMIALLEQIEGNTKKSSASQLARMENLPAGYEDSYHGFPYRQLDGGQIEVLAGNGTRVFKNWHEFHNAVAK